MDFLALAKERKTVYEFSDEPVTNEQINNILEAARWAPSTLNSQPWSFIIIKDKARIAEVMKHCHYGEFHSNPPVVIGLVIEPLHVQEKRIRQGVTAKLVEDQALMNIAMPAIHMVCEATSMGIGSCILTPIELDETLAIPESRKIALIIGLGHEKAGTYQKPRERKALGELIHHERYQND